MLAFARFCAFEGDGKFLVEQNNLTLRNGFSHYPGFHFSAKGFSGLNIFPFDYYNEKLAWTILSGASEDCLEKYETTIEEDAAILAENDDSYTYNER
jgi:hypothetical protein